MLTVAATSISMKCTAYSSSTIVVSCRVFTITSNVKRMSKIFELNNAQLALEWHI